MWIETNRLWLTTEVKGSYMPTEDVLILSSTFSVVVSLIIETLLLFVVPSKSKRTKLWLTYLLMIILFANAALSFVAFLHAPANLSTYIEGYTDAVTASGHADSGLPEWHGDVEMHFGSHTEGFLCGRRVASRWLSLLISIFSIILMVSAWLDFREYDSQESEILEFDEESLGEKGLLLPKPLDVMENQ